MKSLCHGMEMFLNTIRILPARNNRGRPRGDARGSKPRGIHDIYSVTNNYLDTLTNRKLTILIIFLKCLIFYLDFNKAASNKHIQ